MALLALFAAGCGGGGQSAPPGAGNAIGVVPAKEVEATNDEDVSSQIGEEGGFFSGRIMIGNNPDAANGSSQGRMAASAPIARRVGSAPAPQTGSKESADCSGDDFLPGQTVVRFARGNGKVFESQKASFAARRGLQTVRASGELRLFQFESIDPGAADAAEQTRKACRELSADPTAKTVSLNRIYRASKIPNDPLYPQQWHYPAINLPAAWDLTMGKSNVVVAVVDTGLAPNVSQLMGKTIGGYDFVSWIDEAGDGDGPDADYTDEGELSGNARHGTHVAATAVGETNENIGTAGVAWASSLLVVRVMGIHGWGDSYDIMNGMLYAAGLDDELKPPLKADVINLSLGGGRKCDSTEQDVIDDILAAGTVVVAATGNSGYEFVDAPANCDGVIGVGASDYAGRRSWFSSFGPEVDVLAPGGDLSVDLNGDGNGDGVLSSAGEEPYYEWYEGTSMATPHVSGVVALMRSLNPVLMPSEIADILRTTASNRGEAGFDNETGYGLVDAYQALRAVSPGSVSGPARLGFSQGAVSFGNVSTLAVAQAFNIGGGSLGMESVSAIDAPWLDIAWADEGRRIGLEFEADREGLGDGAYYGYARFETTAGTFDLPVSLSVGAVREDIGDVTVLLYRQNDRYEYRFDRLVKFETTFEQGYAFRFSNLPEGVYILLAANDNNGDGVYCGEADYCGFYPPMTDVWGVKIERRQRIEDIAASLFKIRSLDAAYSGEAASARSEPLGRSLSKAWATGIYMRDERR